MSNANLKQVAGSHYSTMQKQPWDVAIDCGCEGFLVFSAIKYVTRYRTKHGVTDLEKAIHFCEKLNEIGFILHPTGLGYDSVGELMKSMDPKGAEAVNSILYGEYECAIEIIKELKLNLLAVSACIAFYKED